MVGASLGDVEAKVEAMEEENEEKQEFVGNVSLNGNEVENTLDFNNEDFNPKARSDPILTKAHFTSLDVDIKDLNCRMNVMTTRMLFSDNAIIKKANPPFFGSTIEIKRTKEAKKSCVGSTVGTSFLIASKDNTLAKM